MKQYYVGANHIASAIFYGNDAPCTFPTVEAAIKAAKRKVISNEVECAVVVQIVRVIKRIDTPVEIIDVTTENTAQGV